MKRKLQTRQLARRLGWLGIGLGVVELVAPRRLASVIGIKNHALLLRIMGLRELASGVGILSRRRPTGWLWSRVAGDALELGLLAASLSSRPQKRAQKFLAAAAVAGVALLDLHASQRMSRQLV